MPPEESNSKRSTKSLLIGSSRSKMSTNANSFCCATWSVKPSVLPTSRGRLVFSRVKRCLWQGLVSGRFVFYVGSFESCKRRHASFTHVLQIQEHREWKKGKEHELKRLRKMQLKQKREMQSVMADRERQRIRLGTLLFCCLLLWLH